MKKGGIATAGLILILSFGCKKTTTPVQEPVTFTATGNIQAKMDEFRNRLGTLNSAPGATSGRREINWDGVPDSLTGVALAHDFFNATAPGSSATRQRGIIYAGTGTPMVSANGFAEINAQAAAAFTNFSGSKSFAVTNSNLWPVEFQVAGQSTAGAVSGFGAVFTDVDVEGSTFLEFFNQNRSIGKFYVPPHDNSSAFSFLGVYFPTEVITRVELGHQGRLSDGGKDITQGGAKDLIVLDDFIYGEPFKL